MTVDEGILTDEEATTEGLLDAWRQAEIDVNGSAIRSSEHKQALVRADQARAEYVTRLDALKNDLRDG
jgi:hypothetical protein